MARRLVKSSFIYTATGTLQKGTAFLLLPLYTRYLTPDDYGTLAVVTAISAFLTIAFTLSLTNALTRYYFEYRDKPQQLKEFWGTLLTFIFLVSASGGGVLLLFGKWLLKPFIGQIPFWPCVALGIAAIIFQPFFVVFLALLQTKEQAGQFAIHSLSQFLTNSALVIGFVVFLRRGTAGILTASLVTAFGFFLISLYSLRHEYKICLKSEYLRQGLSYSLPLVPHSVSSQISFMADRMLLNVLLGVTVTGIYNVGFMFGNVMNFITDGFNRAYVPVTMHVLQSREQTQLNQLSGIGLRLVVCYSLLGTLLSFYAKEITTLSTPAAYHGAYVVVPYVAFAFVLQGLYYIFVTILFFVGKATKYIAFGTAAGAVANVVLNLVMIRPYGLRGAAIATLLAQFVVTVFVAILGKAYEPIRWDYPRFSLIVAICLATSLTVMSLPLSVPIAALKLVLFFGLCCTLNLWLWGDALHLMRRGLQLLRSVSPAV